MKYLLLFLSLFFLVPTSISAQTLQHENPQKERLINVQTDKELNEYFTREDLFMLGLSEITESAKWEMIEKQKKYLAEQKNRPPRKESIKSDLLISSSLQNEYQTNVTHRSFNKIGWANIWQHIEAKTGEEKSPKFEGKSNTYFPCKISFTSLSDSPIRLQFLAKDAVIKIPANDLYIPPKDTVSFEFDYFVEAGYVEKIMQLQMTTKDTTLQIEMPIGTLGYDLISHEFTSYRNLEEEPFVIDKNKTLHLVKKNQETVFSLYPFNTFEKPLYFEPNQEPAFAAAISGNYTPLDLSQVLSGMYLARIIDFSQRNQAFRLVLIE